MTEIQAAIGSVQLKRLPGLLGRRAENARAYKDAFAALTGLVLPVVPPGYTHAWHQYSVRVLSGKRDALAAHLDRAGVDTAVHYPQGLHQTGLFPDAAHGDLRRCEAAAREVLSLPVHPGVAGPERSRVIGAVQSYFAQ
jgi:dTDP-4-amino-4,6-dideoxygalactose transaminase